MKTNASCKCAKNHWEVTRNEEVMATGWSPILDKYSFRFCHYQS